MSLRVVVRKELRQLLPWAVAILVLDVLAFVLALTEERADGPVWVHLNPLMDSTGATASAAVTAIWALVLAYGGFPREYDDRTLPFLLSLPAPRWQLFVAKAAAALAVLLGSVVLSEALYGLLSLPNTSSFGGRTFRVEWAALSLLLRGAFAWIALGYALLATVFRRFGVLVVWLALTVVSYLGEQDPAYRWWNPARLLQAEFEGSRLLVPWGPLAAHGALATGLAALSGYVWVGRVERWTAAMSRLVARGSVRVGFGVLMTALGFGTVAWIARDEAPAAPFDPLGELASPQLTLKTRFYRFRYPSALGERVRRVGLIADRLYEQVALRLGAPLGSERIEVDLSRSSPSHAGTASWNTIRLDLRHADDQHELEYTLAHETSHVLALRVSDRRIADLQHTLRGFDEGLAEYVALQVAPDPAEVEARWLEAVLARERFRLEPEPFFAFAQFQARWGEPLVYAVGFSWVHALVATCGANAPGRMLAALAREQALHGRAGLALWRDLLQAIGCDSSQVAVRWGEELAARAKAFDAELAAVPRLAGGVQGVTEDEEGVVLRAELDRPALEHVSYHVNLRDSASDDAGKYVRVPGEIAEEGGVEFTVEASTVSGQTLDFQFVMSWLRSGVPVSHATEWRQGRVPDGVR